MLIDHRLTIAMLITGLFRSRSGQLPKIAEKVSYAHQKPSLVSRFERYIKSSWVKVQAYYKPVATAILSAVSGGSEPIVLAVDSTKMGGRCICLMVSVIYRNRALPLAWVCFKGKKGHSSQTTQIELLEYVQTLIPKDKAVVLVGDGEFDGRELLSWFKEKTDWQYVCRTCETNMAKYNGKWLSLKEIVVELGLEPGQTGFLQQVSFVQSNPVSDVNIFIAWHDEKQQHIFFVTHCDTETEAKHWYDKRFTIETCFADLKSRGFNLDQTRIRTPERLERLILAVAFAYYFLIMLGIDSIFSGIFRYLVRSDNFFHSLTRLGFIFLDHLLNERLPFPTDLVLPDPQTVPHLVLPP